MNSEKSNADFTPARTDRVHAAECLVRQVHDELRRLLEQRTEIMRRIGTAKKTISGLCALFGTNVASEDALRLVDGPARGPRAGFTRTCRTILMEAEGAMSAREVREKMLERDPTLLSRHKDLLASITTILNRLAEYGEAVKVSNAAGRAWQWSDGNAKDI